MLSPDLTRLAQICASGGDQTNRVLGGCASGAGRSVRVEDMGARSKRSHSAANVRTRPYPLNDPMTLYCYLYFDCLASRGSLKEDHICRRCLNLRGYIDRFDVGSRSKIFESRAGSSALPVCTRITQR